MKANAAMILSDAYTEETVKGAGAVKGAPCQIQDTTVDADGNSVVTFSWQKTDGTKTTSQLIIKKGIDAAKITDISIDRNFHIIVTMSDGTKYDAGELSGGVLKTDLICTVDIGSIVNGKRYPKGTDLEQILRDILIKEVAPSVALSLTPSTALYDVIADEVTSIKLTAAVTKGTYEPTRIDFYAGDVKIHEETISSAGAYAFTYTPEAPIKVDTTFKAVVTDGKLTGQNTKAIKFVAKSYYGTVADTVSDPDEAIVKALENSVLKEAKKLSYGGITMDYGKVVYAYPKSMGDLTSIKDEKNNINYTASFAKTSAVIDGINYNVYTMIKPSKAVDVEIVFS